MTRGEELKRLKRFREQALDEFIGEQEDYTAFDMVIEALKEQKTGRWERTDQGVFCSRCYLGWNYFEGVPADIENRYRYCPNCGAKMEVEHELHYNECKPD